MKNAFQSILRFKFPVSVCTGLLHKPITNDLILLCRRFIDIIKPNGTADLLIQGEIQNDSWTDKQGNKRITTRIIVNDFDFCERKGTQAAAAPAPSAPPARRCTWMSSPATWP